MEFVAYNPKLNILARCYFFAGFYFFDFGEDEGTTISGRSWKELEKWDG